MARDRTASESDESLLERRSYLEMAEVAVSSATASGVVDESASAAGGRPLDVGDDGDDIESYDEVGDDTVSGYVARR